MIFASRLSLDLSLARALFCSDLGATGRCLLLVGFRPRTLGTRSLFMGGRTRVLGASLALCGLLAELPRLWRRPRKRRWRAIRPTTALKTNNKIAATTITITIA